MKKENVVLLILLLMFTACNEQEESTGAVTKVEKELTKEQKTKKVEAIKEKDLLQELGFEFNDDKIIIDINKTSNFFTKIEAEMTAKANEIESKIDNADINITKGMGIEIEGNQIGIDLNKTQNMFQQINVLMKNIFLDINSSKH